MSLVRAVGLKKTYRMGEVTVEAIKGADFTIHPASFVAFVGPSGSGKSTLLNMIGCLDHPSGGSLKVLDTEVGSLDRKQAAAFRGEHIGFVFQDFNLVPVLSVYENIEYPLLMVQNRPPAERRQRVERVLEAVGMAELANKRPDQLSGGQKQRLAIARMLLTAPKVVILDEATSALDAQTEAQLHAALREFLEGRTTLIIAHRLSAVKQADRAYVFDEGRIIEQGSHEQLLRNDGLYRQLYGELQQ